MLRWIMYDSKNSRDDKMHRFEEIQLFASNKNWYSKNILDIALALYSPEENILIFPDFLPTSEKTYTCL